MGTSFRDEAEERAVKNQLMKGLLGETPQGGVLGSTPQSSPVPMQQRQPSVASQIGVGVPQGMQSPAPKQPPLPSASTSNINSLLSPTEKQLAASLIQQGDISGYYALLKSKSDSLKDWTRDNRTDTSGMRKELEPVSKELREAKSNFDALYQTLTKENPNAVDDVAVVFQYMKSLDPGSVVREGEQIMLKRTDGIFGVLGNYLQGLKSGETFNATQRRNILDSAYTNFKARTQPLYEAAQWRGDVAERNRLNRNDVVPPVFGRVPEWYSMYGDKSLWPKPVGPGNGNKPYTPTNNNDYEPL